ncbi:MAG: hypothetical protein JXX28_19180 [Deltaproteobacteria bacterium]|nr:hypothetical protein [Deltaproteobacteria bacterium]
MRVWTALAALTLASSPALAGSLMAVKMDEPVNIYVDGQALRTDAKGRQALLAGLDEGDHHVKVVTVVGSEILWDGTVNLADATQYKTRWAKDGTFSVISSKGWDGGEITGKRAEWVTLAVKAAGAAMAGQSVMDVLGAGESSKAISAPVKAGTERTDAPPAGIAAVTLSVSDGSMVNVWVDGTERLQIRSDGDYSLQVAAGDRQIELKDFPNLKTLAHGTLSAAGGGAVHFTAGESLGLIAGEGADAWKPE